MKVGYEGDEGQDIFGGIGSFFLVLLLLTEFALWIKVAENQKNIDQKKNPGDPGVGCDKPEGISRAHIFSPPLPSSSLPPPPPQTLLEKVIFNKGDPRISEFRRREKVEVV